MSIRQFLLLKNQFQLAIAAPRESIPDKRKRAKTMMAGISAGDCSIFRGEEVNRLEVESHEPFPVVGFGNFYIYAVVREQILYFFGPLDKA